MLSNTTLVSCLLYHEISPSSPAWMRTFSMSVCFPTGILVSYLFSFFLHSPLRRRDREAGFEL